MERTPVKIDTVAPSLSITNPSEGKYQKADVALKALAEDGPGQSGDVSYRYVIINDEKIIGEGKAETVTISSEGDNEVIFYVSDSAGNETEAATRVRIDRTGPEIILVSSVEEGKWHRLAECKRLKTDKKRSSPSFLANEWDLLQNKYG